MTAALHEMLADLESHMLVVQLVPLRRDGRNYNEGGCRRVCADVPPRWYRSLCNRHQSSRGIRRGKFDTRIRRRDILRILGRLADGRHTWSKYADELRAIARKVAA